MFWKFNQPVPIDSVFLKEDTTLNEVLDQENILQELKSMNKKLIEFITRADILNQLVSLVIEEPSEEVDEQERYRRPNLACEVLTTDIPIVNERLSDKALLTKLYTFLEQEPPLNPLLASFFSRVLSMLICRKADQHWYSYQFTCLQFLDFLKTREHSTALLLKHLDTSAIMDLTLKLITQIEGEDMRKNLISWVESEELIENIVDLISPGVDEGTNYNAAQLLCDTIRNYREVGNEPDPILIKIQSPEIVDKLLKNMLNGDEYVESVIVGGISVLLTLLENLPGEQSNRRGTYGSIEDSGSGEPPPSQNPIQPAIIASIVPHLPKLHDLLLNPPKKPPVKLASGTIDPPLGNTRLSVIKLIAALISTNTPEVNEELDRLSTVHVLLDLFFHYTWNNFLHSQIDKCLAFALNSSSQESVSNPLIHSIFIKCRLLQRILDAWQENESEQNKEGGKRRGYMGHLINIANSVIKQGDCLNNFINENIDEETLASWRNYVETTLQPINELHQRYLGGSHPAHNSNRNKVDYNDSNFITDPSLNQSISDFASADDVPPNIQSLIHNFHMLDFVREAGSMEDGNKEDKRAELFKEICSQKKSFADLESGMDDDDDEDWEGTANSWNNTDDFSNSSDEENEKESSPKADEETLGPNFIAPVVDQVNPWDTNNEGNSPNDEGWADFTAFAQDNVISDINFTPKEEATPSLEETPSASCSEKENVITPDVVEKSNKKDSPSPDSSKQTVNANDLVLEDVVAEEELIDNYRFLSIQGLISDSTEVKQPEQQSDSDKHSAKSQSTVQETEPV